ncbi:MAG: hypothetical protein LBF78_04565 [Treponema sp.]|jgi:hypothetical protein|nr:hypothetical protein [Treponema sp.]
MAIKKLESVNRILDFLEENIDENHCEETEKKHLDALFFKQGATPPLSVYCKPEEAEMLSNISAFNNPEVMLHNELLRSETFGNVVNSVRIKDDYPLHIRSNHGLATTLSSVGGIYQLNENATPWAIPLEESLRDYRRKWENKPYDIGNNEVVRKVCDTYCYMKERLAEYPKCSRRIRLTHPDMQGPFNTAQSLFGSNFFMELYDNTEDIHWLLDRVTDAYIELFYITDPLVNNYTADKRALYIHGAIYPGRVLLKNDTATAMLSEEHYLEFCRPYDEKITKTLGKASLHYCGRSQPFHSRVIMMPELQGLNFGDPQMQDIDAFMAEWNARGVAAVCWGYHQPPEFLPATLLGRSTAGFTLCCTINDIKSASEYVKRYRETGLEGLRP